MLIYKQKNGKEHTRVDQFYLLPKQRKKKIQMVTSCK